MIGKTNVGGGSGGAGATLVVSAPVGVTVTATNETLGKTYTRVANSEGKATFKGLASGTWMISMSDASTTTDPVPVVVNSDYAIELSFFSATINVTYPVGSTCTATDGTTTLTAPDATGNWSITVPNAGTWTVTSVDGDKSKSTDVEITTDGQSVSVTLNYELVLFDGSAGGDNTDITGGWTMISTTTAASLTVTETEVSFQSNSTEYNRRAGTANAIDLSEYSTIYFDGVNLANVDNDKYTFMLLNARTHDSTPIAFVRQPLERNVVSIDLSSITPRNMLYVAINNNSVMSPSVLYHCWAN